LFAANADKTNYDASPELISSVTPIVSRINLRPPVDLDALDLELDSLEHQRALMGFDTARTSQRKPPDAAHDLVSDWHLGALLAPAANTNVEIKREETAKPRASFFGWLLMLCGIMAFACGAVLMGMSLAQGRSELWRMGLPLALVGQCGLIVGLVLQLERVWQNHRRANDRLREVDEHVSDLKLTTDLLSTSQSGPSQAFYHHMAGGANTELLLADLKGQMDLLAAQVARRSRR
jgi:hypothetical protein